jgi:hypothetical protein
VYNRNADRAVYTVNVNLFEAESHFVMHEPKKERCKFFSETYFDLIVRVMNAG